MRSFCPRPPRWHVDWEAIDEALPWIRELRGCPQDPVFHAEGDVWVHTRRVCEELTALGAWRGLEEEERETLFWSALLHDVAKPTSTRHEEDGRITSPGHARKGAQVARRLLWEGALPFAQREAVVQLVRLHALPLWLLERDDSERTAVVAGCSVRLDHLALLAEADVRGRQCVDRDDLLERIQLFVELCREQKCLNGPRPFASATARFLYAQGRWTLPDVAPHEEFTGELVVMSGLPGAGKDRWIAEQMPDARVVSLDRIRHQMGVRWTDDQGRVVQATRQRAREHLRQGRSFVWNATNLTRSLREVLVRLATSYRARVRIVYVEASAARLWEQNRERQDAVPAPVMERFLRRWEVPLLVEAHTVEHWVDGKPRPTIHSPGSK